MKGKCTSINKSEFTFTRKTEKEEREDEAPTREEAFTLFSSRWSLDGTLQRSPTSTPHLPPTSTPLVSAITRETLLLHTNPHSTNATTHVYAERWVSNPQLWHPYFTCTHNTPTPFHTSITRQHQQPAVGHGGQEADRWHSSRGRRGETEPPNGGERSEEWDSREDFWIERQIPWFTCGLKALSGEPPVLSFHTLEAAQRERRGHRLGRSSAWPELKPFRKQLLIGWTASRKTRWQKERWVPKNGFYGWLLCNEEFLLHILSIKMLKWLLCKK